MTRGYMPKAQTTEWETPPELFHRLDDEFGPFDLDPCARPEHYTAAAICSRGGMIFTPEWANYYGLGGVDGLSQEWRGRVYMNPPYGKALNDWVAKANSEIAAGHTDLVVALLPARTDTKWWQHYVLRQAWRSSTSWCVGIGEHLRDVRFLPGRLTFVGAHSPATFPSAVVVWRKP